MMCLNMYPNNMFDPYCALVALYLHDIGFGIMTEHCLWLDPNEYHQALEACKDFGISPDDFDGIELMPDKLQDEYMMALEGEVM